MERFAVNAISIMQQILRRAIPGKRSGDLSGSPFGCGMGRHVEVNCASPMVTQNYEDK